MKSAEPLCEENFLKGKTRILKLKSLSNIYQDKENSSISRLIIVKYITLKIKKKYENFHE